MTTVVKLDGRTQDFDKRKIEYAVQAAMNEVGELDIPASVVIADKVEKKFKKRKSVNVSDIQDAVEDAMLHGKTKKAAKEYVFYRRKRNEERESNSSFMEMIKKTMDLKNIERENANTDEAVYTSRQNRVANKMTSYYASAKLLSPEVKKAFEDNWIYIHDFSAYARGDHNCLTLDLAEVLKNGFHTNQTDIREPNSISSAMQLTAVVMQCQSNLQFGGVAVGTIDFDLAPYVDKSFNKHMTDGLKYICDYSSNDIKEIEKDYPEFFKFREEKIKYADYIDSAYSYAWDKTTQEAYQGAEALIHNLNSLQSRAGDQLPFTSINYGMDTTPEGRLVTKSILKATLDGTAGGMTPIFPCQIFQYYKGINDEPGTPNYDLFKLALKCTAHRIYPNYANCSASYFPKPTCKQEIFNTMGCRTQVAKDRFGIKGNQGRGNISPTTINLAKIGIEYGICLGKREKPDIKGFWKKFDEILSITAKALVDRFEYQGKQPAKSAPFMYINQTMKGKKVAPDEPVREVLKHGTLAVGLLGLANCVTAMFGKHQYEDSDVEKFAHQIYQHVYDFTKKASDKYNLNFSVYSTPAESSCYTICTRLQKEYGKIPGVTDRSYLTNSFHCPVWYPISAEDKIKKEAFYHKLSRGGCITYVELDGSVKNNSEALEQLVTYAMDCEIAYFALNFKLDTCRHCHYQDQIDGNCPKCGSSDIQRLRRITGYLTGNYTTTVNSGKVDEINDRYVHCKGNILFE